LLSVSTLNWTFSFFFFSFLSRHLLPIGPFNLIRDQFSRK
jgi:hypothetical protein